MFERVFWILGFGQFGCMAVKRIKQRIFPSPNFVIVDSNSEFFYNYDPEINCCDAIEWLCSAMNQSKKADWIIPTIPLHVAGNFIHRKLMLQYQVQKLPIPDYILKKVPNGFRNGYGQMWVSYADWMCPDNCYEPEDICIRSGKTRPMNMFQFLQNLSFEGIETIVIESKQLMPGVGGYKPKDLLLAVDKIVQQHSGSIFMLSTACKCHGIIDLIEVN